ncbi:hypothetical protein J3L18_14315 [Mucilaginibacter gossypii]|uniref:hypothetical protein n=1 Tax=Mucilaginibacter gossypii TaxID=551996 RepID=UPI000DCB5AC5|nr:MULTISPECIES: hypothetical protein [Mucilaginibacter]QTE40174.1 hypothetical protein J3L18_14315 [Mucilaginibacter gossypii]RAV50111.1 hypothetical protein DIU36_26860 [Mucilaginibacter rubeus]
MLKLYKKDAAVINYWETWDKDDKTGLIHWGIVGEVGQNEEIHSSLLSSFRKKIQTIINKKIDEGYRHVDIDDHYTLLIEYIIEGMGTPEDIEKRTRLQNKMDEVLGWTGLGHCDGGSTGGGTMEVCCLVIDFDLAKTVIEVALQNTEFANYVRIYDENQ